MNRKLKIIALVLAVVIVLLCALFILLWLGTGRGL